MKAVKIDLKTNKPVAYIEVTDLKIMAEDGFEIISVNEHPNKDREWEYDRKTRNWKDKGKKVTERVYKFKNKIKKDKLTPG